MLGLAHPPDKPSNLIKPRIERALHCRIKYALRPINRGRQIPAIVQAETALGLIEREANCLLALTIGRLVGRLVGRRHWSFPTRTRTGRVSATHGNWGVFAMQILKTLFFFEGGDFVMGDTITHENGLWLVPNWTEPQAGGLIYPSRIIRIDKLRYQKMPIGNPYGADYSLTDPLPKELFDAQIPQELRGKFDVVEGPNIGIRPPAVH